MTYEKQTWANRPDKSTPITAARLNHMEDGIELAASLVTLVRSGEGSPEGVVAAPVGTLYLNSSGSSGTTLYVKESGTGSTGWAAK